MPRSGLEPKTEFDRENGRIPSRLTSACTALERVRDIHQKGPVTNLNATGLSAGSQSRPAKFEGQITESSLNHSISYRSPNRWASSIATDRVLDAFKAESSSPFSFKAIARIRSAAIW